MNDLQRKKKLSEVEKGIMRPKDFRDEEMRNLQQSYAKMKPNHKEKFSKELAKEEKQKLTMAKVIKNMST